MTTSIPDDHYAALGVARDATSAAIKTAYRKLVLKHHPDKVDDTDKTAAADRFHKIQTAWETIGDDEKRGRYDAHVRLASLKREKELSERDRFRTPDYRSASFRGTGNSMPSHPPQSPRAPPSRGYSYVEVKPSFDAEAFDRQRTSERKDFDFESDRRRRSEPKDDRHRMKPVRQDSKETERARFREKGRQTTKATTRDRDAKYSYSKPEVTSDSDSESYFARRSPRDMRMDEREREHIMEAHKRQAEAAKSDRLMHDQAQRMLSDAQNYQLRMRSGRRPSPTRISSSRDHTEFGKTADGRPAAVRRGSAKPRTSSRDDLDAIQTPRRSSDKDTYRSSNEYESGSRRPPGLSQSKSAPYDIHIPLEKQRSNSVQHQSSDDFIPSPVRRADSMPHAAPKERSSKPVRASALRQASTTDDYDHDRRSPTRTYGRSSKDYDIEPDSPVRDPYRTEVRKPVGREMTRSPSPMRTNEKTRSSSNRHPVQPPHLPRTSSTTYSYPMQTGADVLTSRPKLSRGDSGNSYLYGEVRGSRDGERYSSDNVRVRERRPDIKVSSGYTATDRRGSENRSPGYNRTYSYNQSPVPA